MPFFKTTYNILFDHGEFFDENWMDSDKLILPETKKWDYKRELTIEDVDLWEVILENDIGLYAAWSPYAEFYLIRLGWGEKYRGIETYYGPGAQKIVFNRMKELGQKLFLNKIWVENEDVELYIY